MKAGIYGKIAYRCGQVMLCAAQAQAMPNGSMARAQMMRRMREHLDVIMKIDTPQEKKTVVRKRRTS